MRTPQTRNPAKANIFVRNARATRRWRLFEQQVGLHFHDPFTVHIFTDMALERPISELLRRAGVLVYTAPETSVQSAAETMAQHNIGSILVMENGEDLVGIFSERDLLNRVTAEGRDPASTAIRDVMTEDVIVVSGETSRREALHIMQEQHIRHLPIADDEKLYGIVSLRDLLSFEQEMQEQEIEQLRRFVYDKPYPSYPG